MNPEKARANNAESRAIADPEKTKAAIAKWQNANLDKVRAAVSKWQKENPEKGAAKCAKRRAVKRLACPEWRNEFFIQEAYDLAKRRTKLTGIQHVVDHTIPLISKHVCGLHVEHNLRVITHHENSVKSNVHWPDMGIAA